MEEKCILDTESLKQTHLNSADIIVDVIGFGDVSAKVDIV